MNELSKIAVLCALPNSIYKTLPGIEVYDKERNAYTFSSKLPVICHPPCQQWSRMKAFAKEDQEEKDLAMFCLHWVHKNGGILEHPAGSSFFKYAGIKPTLSIDQSWFGFPARKRTYLYFFGCCPLPVSLSFDAITEKVCNMTQWKRSYTTLNFANWLIDCVRVSSPSGKSITCRNMSHY